MSVIKEKLPISPYKIASKRLSFHQHTSVVHRPLELSDFVMANDSIFN